MNIDPIYFPLLAAVITGVFTGVLGIVLGGILNEVRGRLEIRRENRRVLSMTLYHELELLGQLSLVEKSFTDELIANFNKHLNLANAAPAESKFVDLEAISRLLLNITKEAKEPEIAEIVQKHDALLLDLAAAAPLLAADLRPEYHFPFSHRLDSIFRKLPGLPIEDPEGRAFINSVSPWISDELEGRLLSSLKKSVTKVGWKISWLTWFKVRRRIHTLNIERTRQIDEFNRDYVAHVVKFVMRNLIGP